MSKQAMLMWAAQIREDMNCHKIYSVYSGFQALLEKPAYHGLDYAVFLEGAKEDKKNLELFSEIRSGKPLEFFKGRTFLHDWTTKGDIAEAYKAVPKGLRFNDEFADVVVK